MNEREDFFVYFDVFICGWVRKLMEFCKGVIRLWKEYKLIFFYLRSDRVLFKKSFRFLFVYLFVVYVLLVIDLMV